MKNSRPLVAAILVFAGCLCVGFWIARHKALWNDEFFSQAASIDGTSFADQFTGHMPKAEGGNAPLFYALQKAFLQLIHYQTPSSWLQGHWSNDPSSQILLRINPILFMSLSVGLVFYYFCRKYAWWVGFLSLFIYFSSHMLWIYWVQARPYALLVFLTTVQSIIFLSMMEQPSGANRKGKWMMLAGTNILLSLTSILSLGEIMAMSILWWALIERDWKKYIFVTLLPAMIVIFYYMHAPRFSFTVGASRPGDLFHDNISKQCFYIIYIFLISLSVFWVGQKNRFVRDTISEEIIKPVPYVIFLGMALAFSAALLCLLTLHAKPGPSFPITSRYLIYLTPIGVMATTILTVTLFKSISKNNLLKWIVIAFVVVSLGQHFKKTFPKEIHSIISG